MENKELVTKIKEMISEEEKCYDKYIELSKNAPDIYSCIFIDIANEELSHKKHLEEIIKDIGCICENEEEEIKTNIKTISKDSSLII